MHIHHFKTAFWLQNRHLQTSWGSFFRKVKMTQAQRVYIPLQDGVSLAGDLMLPKAVLQTKAPPKEVCLIFHGITGSSTSHYMLGYQQAIFQANLHVATLAINHRGSLGVDCPALSSPRLYHAGMVDDLQDCVAFVRKKWPDAVIRAVGISLSGNMLVRALGLGLLPELASVMVISVPFELQGVANQADQGMGRLYQRYLVKRMHAIVALKKKHSALLKLQFAAGQHLHYSLSRRRLKTFWGVDNFIIGPLHGFRNVHHYYKESSCRHLIQEVKQPLLIVQALDDPLVPFSTWPASSQIPAHVTFEAYDRGGHVGFIGPKGYWLDQRIIRWLQDEQA